MALRNQEIAERIKALREARGNPPQPVVAAAVGVSLRTYQNWEGADAKPEYRNLENLAAYYGVSEQFILSGDSAPREDPVVVSETVEGGFEEFRTYVRELKEQNAELLAEIAAVKLDNHEQLAEQTAMLKELRQLVAELPAMREVARAFELLHGDEAAPPAQQTPSVGEQDPGEAEGRSRPAAG
jgi:transcriptional regulator with XRE-family HTH domain